MSETASAHAAATVTPADGYELSRQQALLKAGALQNAILTSASFSIIATDEKGIIQLFNVGAERMLGYQADEVVNKIRPSDIHDPQEVRERAEALSAELGTSIETGFEALTFKASRGIEDVYELTYICKDGSRFPAIVSITELSRVRERLLRARRPHAFQAGADQSAVQRHQVQPTTGQRQCGIYTDR